MTVKEIKELMPKAIKQFKERIPSSEEWIDKVQIKVCTRVTAERVFYETLEKLNGWDKDFSFTTIAEVIAGDKEYAILIYQYQIKTEFQLYHTLWHELGHICSNIANNDLEEEAQLNISNRIDMPLASGCSVWLEFIANAIANYVSNQELNTKVDPRTLQDNLFALADAAFDSGRLAPWRYGDYFAYLITDIYVSGMIEHFSTENRQPSIGLDDYSKEVQTIIIQMNNFLLELLERKGYFGEDSFYSPIIGSTPFYSITRAELEMLGSFLDELYDIVHG